MVIDEEMLAGASTENLERLARSMGITPWRGIAGARRWLIRKIVSEARRLRATDAAGLGAERASWAVQARRRREELDAAPGQWTGSLSALQSPAGASRQK